MDGERRLLVMVGTTLKQVVKSRVLAELIRGNGGDIAFDFRVGNRHLLYGSKLDGDAFGFVGFFKLENVARVALCEKDIDRHGC
jgi:hypothetical protein